MLFSLYKFIKSSKIEFAIGNCNEVNFDIKKIKLNLGVDRRPLK